MNTGKRENLDALAKIAGLNAALLAAMSVFRAGFFLYFSGNEPYALGEIFEALAAGVSADLVIVGFLGFPATIALALVVRSTGQNSLWQVIRWYYFAAYALVFAIQCVDLGFYGYFKEHMNASYLAVFGPDRRIVLATITDRYNVFVVAGEYLLLLAILYQMCAFFTGPSQGSGGSGKKGRSVLNGGAFGLLLGCHVFALAALAGWAPAQAGGGGLFRDYFLNRVSENGALSLYRAMEAGLGKHNAPLIKAMGYEGDIGRAFADFLNVDRKKLDRNYEENLVKRTKINPALERIKPNVILVVMESFDAPPIKYSSETFNLLGELKQHFDRDYVFANFFCQGTTTQEAFETILLNILKTSGLFLVFNPKYYDFSASPLGGALPFKKAGYATELIATQCPNPQTQRALGFDGAFLPEAEKNPERLERDVFFWDEDIFNLTFERLSSGDPRPKFLVAQTYVNHPPYYPPPNSYRALLLRIPETLKGVDPRMLLTYQYANQKLGEFITRVKRSKYGHNTIIAVTGDHHHHKVWPGQRYGPLSFLNRYRVPFYLYIPGALRPRSVDTDTYGSHLDIMPTLYHLALSGAEYVAMGGNLLDSNLPHNVILPDASVILNKDRVIHVFPPYSLHPAAARTGGEDDPELRSMITYYKAAHAIKEHLIGKYRKE